MKKIFICIPTLAGAGAERFVTELACFINKYEPIVVVTRYLDLGSSFYNKLKAKGIRVIDVSGKNYLVSAHKVIKLIKSEKPVIIHTNVGAALHMLVPCFLSRTKAKHLFTTHSMGYRIFSGLKKTIMRTCFKKGWVVPVAICDTVKKSIIDTYALCDAQVECVYNGVDTTIFTPEEHESKTKVFVSVGRFEEVKNHKLLLDAFSVVNKKYSNTELLLVGDGILRDDINDQVQKLQLTNNVRLVGSQSDVSAFLNSADVYCCSSLVEGLPISVLEAMSCGLPIITTPAGGVVDIVKNEANGFVVAADATEMAQKMEFLIENDVLMTIMGKKSREMAKLYDIRCCASQYEELYKKYSHSI